MRSKGETRLVALVVLVSLTLTGVTVWAVAQQGKTLQQREMADLVNQATTAATHRLAALRGSLQRAGDEAARRWRRGGLDDLDVWAAEQETWLVTCVQRPDEPWVTLPQTFLSQPVPGPRDPNEAGPPAMRYDLNATLDYFRQLASSPDPLTRAGALLGSAAYEQKLGHPLSAARLLADAAELLRADPELARYAFRADVRRIDALMTAGEFDYARDGLRALVESLLHVHPGRLGARELERIQQQANRLGVAPDDEVGELLPVLRRRVEEREVVNKIALDAWQARERELDIDAGEVAFSTIERDGQPPLVCGAQRIGPECVVVLVTPADWLLDRYWMRQGIGIPWQATLGDEAASRERLIELGPAFGGAVLVPTRAAQAALEQTGRRRTGTVVAVGAATVGAWGLVIWMMLRVVARQRELAHIQSRFVADISHELKTPLALIRLLAETLAERRVRDPNRMQNYHETITRESERLSALLDNILDLGRIESGRKQYEFALCDVGQVARQAWTLYEPQFTSDGFDAQLELAGPLPLVRADASALQQVIVNLLQNAYRYASEQRFVRLRVAREGHLIVITVEDRGIGMNRAQLNRLGDSFFRAEDTRVRQQRGTGLGLAIVNHIVTAHHGKMEVRSQPGRGSTFTIWIPCEPPESEGHGIQREDYQ